MATIYVEVSDVGTQCHQSYTSSPAEFVPHLVQVISGPVELCLHVVPASIKLSFHGLHLMGGEREAALQVLILLLEDSG